MKKLLSILLVLFVLWASSALAQENTTTLPDVSSLSVSELKELKNQINERLIALGELYEAIGKKASGENVSLLQKRLKELGYLNGEASGTWDKVSIAAMKDYEKAVGVKKSDGLASVAEQEAIFSANAQPKPTPEPTATPKPTPTANKKKGYGTFSYKSVSRNPEEYIGDKVKISGYVLQVMGNRTDGYDIRLATKGRYDNIVYIYILPENAPDYNILEDDKLILYATLAGDYMYTSTLGAEITLPLASADIVEMND